jgi:hypothetical protein
MKSYFIDGAKASKIIGSIKGRNEKLSADIQKVAESAIYHANTDGNADIGMRLVEACSTVKGLKTTSLLVYLCTHGKFQINEKSKK